MLGLLGLPIFEATSADIADLGEEQGHRVLRVCRKGTKVVLIPLPPDIGLRERVPQFPRPPVWPNPGIPAHAEGAGARSPRPKICQFSFRPGVYCAAALDWLRVLPAFRMPTTSAGPASVGDDVCMGQPPRAESTSESAVLVPILEAEPVVGLHRARLDPAAAWGVPAHVTVLYPFVVPSEITAASVEAAAAAVASVPAFMCEFGATAWFGEEVMWLAPRPNEPFRMLTRALVAAFPSCVPYGGAYEDLEPHLTVGYESANGVVALQAAEADVLLRLPVRALVSRVWLMTGNRAPASWHVLAEMPLAAI